ncbi:hypothetical protein GPUN_2317 [Glaciecola punicea ACAM 611]|uniref:Uncharacterized protein n=2 Tax=Glaciecola TaxID=89404 RepID=H5TDQ5_9ALTE|nr:hypothetical protein BAE46_05435 [Glaciecola punicea]GAB56432.1 hypothetical protein GPUN_2317 [Glaciecola punicea ACAM 611]
MFAFINSLANEQAMHLINQVLDNSPNDSKLWRQLAQLARNYYLQGQVALLRNISVLENLIVSE